MKALAKEFSAALARVMLILKTRTTLPILTCIKLEATGGILKMTATDLDAFAAASCPCTEDLEPVCVDALILNYLVRQAPETIEMTLDKNGRLLVQGAGTSRLVTQDAGEFPTWPEQKQKELGVNLVDLADCLRAVAWAPEINPKDRSDFWKELILVRTTAKTLECCGTSGKEFAHVKLAAIAAPAQFLFPAKQADLLINALDTGAKSVSLSTSWLFTVADNFSLAVKLAEDKYVPFERILEQDKRSLGVLNLSMVLDSLHTIKALGHGEPFLECRMEFEKETLTILFKSKLNDFERSIPHQLEGKDCAISLDAVRALRVFSHVLPGSKAWLGSAGIIFTDGDHTFGLALLVG